MSELTLEERFEEFEALCKKHDQYYGMSDDHSVYVAGRNERQKINATARTLSHFDEQRVKQILDTHCKVVW